MKHAPTSFSLSILIAGLLAGTSMVSPTSVAAATSDLQAQTGWAITRVASMTQGSYCTMAQKFSNETIMTIAKNNAGEYSLAFDFQSPKFETGKATTASVKAGSGSSQTFEVQPASTQAVVIGLGKDEEFISTIKSSGKIQLDIEGASYSFNTVKFAEAQDEMATCMSSMKPQLREAKNEVKTAPKAEAATPETKTETKVAKSESSSVKAEPKLSAEDLTAAPVEPLAVSSASSVEPSSSNPDESLAAENARLKKALAEARRGYENQMTAQQGAIVPELQEKIRTLDKENAGLKDQLAKAKPQDNKQDMTRLAAELDKARQELAAASEQNKALQTQVAAASAVKQDATKATQSAQLSQREAEALKAENQTLKNQLQIAAKEEAKSGASSADTAKLQQENSDLRAELAELSKKAAAAPAIDPAQNQEIAYLRAENEKLVKDLAAKPGVKQVSGASAELQKRLSELQAENATLKTKLADASDSMTPLPSAAPVAPMSATEQENLRAQIRDLRGQLEIVESESAGLKKQLEIAQKSSETTQLKVAGGNWDLEQATRRYQESQREIRRLGALLEEDRAKCKQEKKDIEYMLFDPEVAKPAQISMLTNLEDQVAAKDAKISELETALKSAGIQPASGGEASDEIKVVAKASSVAPAVASEKLLSADVKPMQEQAPSAVVKNAETLKAPIPAYGVAAAPQPAVQAPLVAAANAPAAPVPFPLQGQQQPVVAAPVAAAAPVAITPIAAAPVAMAPSPSPVPAPVPLAVAPQAVPVSAPIEGTRFQSSQDFASILQDAGVTIRGSVQPVQKVSSATYKAFSWQTDSLYGSAEQRPMPAQTAFEPAVQQYIDRAKSRCKGDFAAVPAEIRGSVPAEGYEIACVSGQTGSSASVLFTYKDGMMTTVAHEGRAEAMDIAMDARDRVAARITAN